MTEEQRVRFPNPTPLPVRYTSVYRYRLVDEQTGRDLGPFASARLAFQVGESISRRPTERYEIANVVATEDNEPFRAYLIVRTR